MHEEDDSDYPQTSSLLPAEGGRFVRRAYTGESIAPEDRQHLQQMKNLLKMAQSFQEKVLQGAGATATSSEKEAFLIIHHSGVTDEVHTDDAIKEILKVLLESCEKLERRELLGQRDIILFDRLLAHIKACDDN